MADTALHHKYSILTDTLRNYGRLCIGYSGGADSAFLLYAAKNVLGADNVLAVLASGSFMMERELDAAVRNAADIGITPCIIQAGEYDIAEFVQNIPERCYYCKKHIFSAIAGIAKSHGFDIIADGSNTDDAADFRPGRRALAELGVVSPLAQAGFSKADIRAMSREFGLQTADLPARACLASRIPYGTEITPERLNAVSQAEEFLMDLGFREVRARYHGTVCIIEVPPQDFERLILERERITAHIKALGFLYVTMDLIGIRTGSMNEVL